MKNGRDLVIFEHLNIIIFIKSKKFKLYLFEFFGVSDVQLVKCDLLAGDFFNSVEGLGSVIA